MRKIKDRLILGAISGIVASIPFQILIPIEHKLKITDVPFSYSAAKLFLPKSKTKTFGGKLLSVFVNFTTTGIVGTLITYVLSLTGKDNALVKGAGIGTLLWLSLSGFVSNVFLNVQSKKPLVPLLSLIDHVLFGALTSLIITKLGEDSIFPDANVSQQEKIPLIYTGDISGNHKEI